MFPKPVGNPKKWGLTRGGEKLRVGGRGESCDYQINYAQCHTINTWKTSTSLRLKIYFQNKQKGKILVALLTG